ncbi:type II toxin-antitoxin system RelE family toxin [Marinobacter sp. Arc7-DN-1]|uniref:type II toxin-antitoxin system RelE family toxin n=1 Tax=Marinobacter sp. Arc7-DN-1 TaxID=2304594 RepID=UPI000E44723F|nr:type II toxin-antitoxin system RelE/ParE family toxin [Marinobacter sp. Arc7-DN-1]AXS82499.1 type II toxin-antitoxin system RelE/ParE family toxin [Marinobacter sp. Arc7-DN-1]
MSSEYQLAFKRSALKEWKKLAEPVKKQFKKKLEERLDMPRVASDALSGFENYYKIKLRSVGYRLVYEVQDETVTVTVIAVGTCERADVYRKAKDRLE